MNRAAFLALSGLFVSFLGCGEKNAPVPAAEAAVEEAPKADIPADSNSQKFAEKLVNANIHHFKPSSSGGATFVYNTFVFTMDNKWTAAGYVEAAGETMDCKESGSWTMEPAESATTAMMNWTLLKTDCPGRETPHDSRVEVSINKEGRIDVAFR